MNSSDCISIKRDSDYFDFEENFANDNLLFESYEYLLPNITVDKSSINITWDEKNIYK